MDIGERLLKRGWDARLAQLIREHSFGFLLLPVSYSDQVRKELHSVEFVTTSISRSSYSTYIVYSLKYERFTHNTADFTDRVVESYFCTEPEEFISLVSSHLLGVNLNFLWETKDE